MRIQKDAIFHVKKLAEFRGFPFHMEEEENGKVAERVRLCSLEHLKNFDVNKDGGVHTPTRKYKSSSFFLKVGVEDWTNSLKDSIAKRYKKIMEENLGESRLRFELFQRLISAGSNI